MDIFAMINKMITLMMIGLIAMPAVLAGSKIIEPIADAYTDSNHPSTNYDNDNLKAGYDLNFGKHRSYLKFDLSSLSGKTITSASLSLRAISVVNTTIFPTINLNYVSNDAWNENSITWNNAPSYSTLIDSKTIDVSGRISYNVVSKISESDGILSLALVSSQETTSNLYVQFFSKDLFLEEGPYLEVSYEGADCNTDADTSGDGKISMSELLSYIGRWKSGEASMMNLLNAISYWKAGAGC